jgi:hypothetical protein
MTTHQIYFLDKCIIYYESIDKSDIYTAKYHYFFHKNVSMSNVFVQKEQIFFRAEFNFLFRDFLPSNSHYSWLNNDHDIDKTSLIRLIYFYCLRYYSCLYYVWFFRPSCLKMVLFLVFWIFINLFCVSDFIFSLSSHTLSWFCSLVNFLYYLMFRFLFWLLFDILLTKFAFIFVKFYDIFVSAFPFQYVSMVLVILRC